MFMSYCHFYHISVASLSCTLFSQGCQLLKRLRVFKIIFNKITILNNLIGIGFSISEPLVKVTTKNCTLLFVAV